MAEEKKQPNEEVESETTENLEEQVDEVSELKGQLDDMENKYLRAQAEIQNIQNRSHKEQSDLIKYEGQKLASELLPIIDNLQRALIVEVTDENGKQLKSGVQMVNNHLLKALKDNGVEEINAQNQPFDPKFHQAIQTIAADEEHPKDTVVNVLQAGYVLKDRVLRPAMVVVAQ